MWACGSSQNTVLLALQKIVHKGDECILKDNNERSKWYVTGPGGVDMLVPSVGLIIPPPNPLAVDLSSKYVVQVLAGCDVDTGREKCGRPRYKCGDTPLHTCCRLPQSAIWGRSLYLVLRFYVEDTVLIIGR